MAGSLSLREYGSGPNRTGLFFGLRRLDTASLLLDRRGQAIQSGGARDWNRM